jgi:hypothetical protein
MMNSTRVGLTALMCIFLALAFSVAYAGNEKTNATKSMSMTSATNNISNAIMNMTNVTKNLTMPENMTNVTKNMTNAINPFAKVKGAVLGDPYSNNVSHPPDEVYLPDGVQANT